MRQPVAPGPPRTSSRRHHRLPIHEECSPINSPAIPTKEERKIHNLSTLSSSYRPATPFAPPVSADAGMQVQFRGQALTFRVPDRESGPDWFRQASLPLLALLRCRVFLRGVLECVLSAQSSASVCAQRLLLPVVAALTWPRRSSGAAASPGPDLDMQLLESFVGTGFRERGHAPHAHQGKIRRRRGLFCRVWRVYVCALLCFVLASHRQASGLNTRASAASQVRPYIHLPHDRRELYSDLYPLTGAEEWTPDACRRLGTRPRGGKKTLCVLVEIPLISKPG